MPKRSRITGVVNTVATRVVTRTTQPPTQSAKKNPAAVALGRLGGAKGGPARAKSLTKAERSEIASKAAQARWAKRK